MNRGVSFYKIISSIMLMIFFLSFMPSNNKDINDEYGFYCERPYHKNTKIRMLSIEELLKFIIEIEEVLNKDVPTLKDYWELVPDSAETPELDLELEYCEKVLKLPIESLECGKFTQERAKNASTSPSFRMMAIKAALTKNPKSQIKIFIDPNIHKCPEPSVIFYKDGTKAWKVNCSIKIKAVAKIDNKQYKDFILELPCDEGGPGVFGKFYRIIIDGRAY